MISNHSHQSIRDDTAGLADAARPAPRGTQHRLWSSLDTGLGPIWTHRRVLPSSAPSLSWVLTPACASSPARNDTRYTAVSDPRGHHRLPSWAFNSRAHVTWGPHSWHLTATTATWYGGSGANTPTTIAIGGPSNRSAMRRDPTPPPWVTLRWISI
jgi:hypothetical protein